MGGRLAMKNRTNQLKKVYDAFFEQTITMKEADKISGIMRESICWYCKELRESNRLFKVGKRLCSVTKHRATTYTTNPDNAPFDNQFKLFQV
jgi:hypothetical protein